MNPITLFKLRAAVGRFGEMDGAKWWNTEGVLGSRGEAVYRRGLRRTHPFARVRLVSAVARHRSRAVFPSPGAATLWDLPAAIERELSFAERSWAKSEEGGGPWPWKDFMEELQEPRGDDLGSWLSDLGLVDSALVQKASALSLESGDRAIRVTPTLDDEAIKLLAAAHMRGSLQSLVVPFVPDVLGAAA